MQRIIKLEANLILEQFLITFHSYSYFYLLLLIIKNICMKMIFFPSSEGLSLVCE